MENEDLFSDLHEEPLDPLSSAYPELEKLKAANEALRNEGKEWLLTTLENICNEINQASSPSVPPAPAAEPTLQVGNQDWQFEVEQNVMVGERLGIRHKGQTLLIEVGWPRLPEHGVVPDLGLARARVSFSQNIMIDAQGMAEFTLRRKPDGGDVSWHEIAEHKVGGEITADQLRAYVQQVLRE
jgi:hypothetical protein